jgi:septum formation protein
MKFILGSKSIGRQKVLKSLGYDFDVMVPAVDEKAIRDPDLEKMVLKIANAKADVLLPQINEDAILIVGDQVVIFNGKLREKPKDEKEAREFLQGYDVEHPIGLIGAITLVNTKTKKRASGVQKARIFLRKISNDDIEEHIKSGKALHAACGFMIEQPEIQKYIDRIEGNNFKAVMGLSDVLFKKLLAEVM